MPHLGIAHEDERDVRLPVDNILSQSVADVSPLRTGRTGVRGGGIVSEAVSKFGEPTAPRGVINPRLARLPEQPVTREGDFIPRRVTQELGLQPREEGQPPSVFRPETRAEAAARAEVFTPGRGIATPSVPVLGEIDFTSIEGLLKGVGSVADFTRNLQKFNRSRGITPGKGGKQAIKTSDIQNRIKFLQEQTVGNPELLEDVEFMGNLDILNQFMDSRTGVTAARSAERAADEERIRKLIDEVRAN